MKEDYDKILEERNLLHCSIHEFVARVRELMAENEELKRNLCKCSQTNKSDVESETQ